MATKIIMPKLGMAMKDGVVAKWVKKDGDPVEKGEQVAVVMSKKITYNLLSPASGILRIAVKEKQTRVVAATLGFVTEPGEAVPAVEDVVAAPEEVEVVAPEAAAAAPAAAGEKRFVLASPAARRVAKEKDVDLTLVTGTGADGMVTEGDVARFAEEREKMPAAPEVLATSAAKKLAQEKGINLAQVKGTGPGGRITEQDVLGFAERPAAAPAAPARIIPFAGMRQAIAENMVGSLQTMAQVTLHMEVDATELVKMREQLKADFELTYTDLLIKAVSIGLKRHPNVNATLIGDEIHLLEPVHVGVAVALEDGLIVPIVRDADKKSLQEIAKETHRLAAGARDGSLPVDEVTGGTFTITNLGAYGVDGFTPIINPPEMAILGVGRIVEKPAVHDGQIVKRSLMELSLTIDHRILDGAPGADFLRTVKQLLESPYRILV